MTGAQPRLYLNMAADGTMDLATSARSALAPSTSLAGSGEVPPLHASRKSKKKERPDTAGAAWGHMAAKELTPELKRDLQIIRMRGVLDPKRFYRSSDMKKELPKYFQVGTLVEGAADGRSARLTRRERKASMLQADPALRKRAKKRFHDVQAATSEGVRRSSFTPGQKSKRRKASAKR